jgi:hypothetical protein
VWSRKRKSRKNTTKGWFTKETQPDISATSSAPALAKKFGATSSVPAPAEDFGAISSALAPAEDFGATSSALAPAEDFGATSSTPAEYFGATSSPPRIQIRAIRKLTQRRKEARTSLLLCV